MAPGSDAHQIRTVPAIAASPARLNCAPRNPIWVALRRSDSLQQLSYSLAATFLGRMCLSGNVETLASAHWKFVREAIALHDALAHVIATSRFQRFGAHGFTHQHLSGWQAVTAHDPEMFSALVIWHAFAAPPAEVSVPLPSSGRWGVFRHLADDAGKIAITKRTLRIATRRPWSGGVVVLTGGEWPGDLLND